MSKRKNKNIGLDNVFTTKVYEWDMPSFAKPFHIIPIGDVHRGSPGHCKPAFKETVAYIRKLHDEGAEYRLIGLGDYGEYCSDTEREKLARQGKAGLHESTHSLCDATSNREIQDLYGELSFTKDHWLGFVQGNHYWRFLTDDEQEKGKTSDQILAAKLGGEWLGWASYIVVQLNYGGCKTRLDIFASHGKGGGSLVGSPYNNVGKMRTVFPSADIYMMGHDHNRGIVPDTTLEVNIDSKNGQPVVKDRNQLICRTGSFLGAYKPGAPNYVTRALWSPSSLGHVEIVGKVTRTRKCTGMKRMTRLKLEGRA
jgi:hypothetical protein